MACVLVLGEGSDLTLGIEHKAIDELSILALVRKALPNLAPTGLKYQALGSRDKLFKSCGGRAASALTKGEACFVVVLWDVFPKWLPKNVDPDEHSAKWQARQLEDAQSAMAKCDQLSGNTGKRLYSLIPVFTCFEEFFLVDADCASAVPHMKDHGGWKSRAGQITPQHKNNELPCRGLKQAINSFSNFRHRENVVTQLVSSVRLSRLLKHPDYESLTSAVSMSITHCPGAFPPVTATTITKKKSAKKKSAKKGAGR